jgi:hypothetical protein
MFGVDGGEIMKIKLICAGCGKTPSQIAEYVEAAAHAQWHMTPDDYVWENEGTLNRKTGRFWCDECYIDLGCPSADHPLTMTPDGKQETNG